MQKLSKLNCSRSSGIQHYAWFGSMWIRVPASVPRKFGQTLGINEIDLCWLRRLGKLVLCS